MTAGLPTAERASDAAAASAAFPIVGIGASAGGIVALEQFFAHMPPDSGMAFVVILHLNPMHESMAATVLQSYTSMPVTQVTETVVVEPDHVYVIPPARQISLVDGCLQLDIPADEHARYTPINQFFRTLAEIHRDRAAAIVLSGMGADGALGVQQVKEHGGITLAQDPEEAELDMMPRSAIATGYVDFVLPVAQMPSALIDAWRIAGRPPAAEAPMTDAEAFAAIGAILSAQTGYDFSRGAPETLRQRTEQRMQAHGVAEPGAYMAVLRAHPEETQMLLRDLLAHPGSFFSDADTWRALAAVIPHMFADKHPQDQVRVWVAGCATGEEAYSVAILLQEYASTLEHSPGIRVFATDMNADAIRLARQGLFPETIAADVSPERLQRFFIQEHGRYRIKSEIRDLVLFAPHNLLHDPPFSRPDLIICRHRLRYLDREVQKRLLLLFHFIIQPGGYLLLGESESTASVPGLFAPLDPAAHLFQRQAAQPGAARLPVLPLFGAPASRMLARAGMRAPTRSFSDLHQQLLAQHGPPSIIVNIKYEIVHQSQLAGRFLKFGEGGPPRDLFQAIHPDLHAPLRAALLDAVQNNRSAEARLVPVDLDGRARLIDMTVHPVQEPAWARGCVMIVFHELGDASTVARGLDRAAAPLLQQQEAELQHTREQLHAMVEQYEITEEEYRAANEELQASNEELHIMTVELRAREEDLQSANEELMTINQDLKEKVDEISQTNNDLLNLMISTEIGTIFVDRELRIKRYTPSAQTIFNLIPDDINRPLAHITHRLAYDQIVEDAARVLQTATKIEREVMSQDGCCYLARLLPYRTFEDTIEGVILTFVDITERKQTDRRVQFQAKLLDIVEQAVIATDTSGIITYWNRFAERLYGWTAAEAVGRPISDVVIPEASQQQNDQILAHLRSGESWSGEYTMRRRDGTTFPAFMSDTPIRDENGQLAGIVGVSIDISVPKRTQTELQRALAEVHVARDQLQALSRRLLDVQEAERRTIARELHDEIGQDLTGLSLRLLMIDPHDFPEAIRAHMQEAQRQVNHIMAQVRRMSLDLRPPMLDDLGLLPALQWHIQRYSEQTHIQVALMQTGLEERRFAPDVEITAYRVVQEALTNVARYAGVDAAKVQVWADDAYLHVQIEDHGRGFDPTSKRYASSGLSGMRERVQLLQGSLTIVSAPGTGTCVRAVLPLAETAERQEENHGRANNRAG